MTGHRAVTSETIRRWLGSLSDAELSDPGEPILELRLHADSAHGFEPILTDDWDEDETPEITLH
jgi:hypothetical protein